MDSQVTFGLGMDIDTSRIDRLADSLETILKSLEKSMGMLDNKTFLKDQIDQVNILVTKLKEFKDILNSTSVKNTNPMDNISKEVKNTEQEIKKLQGTVDSLNTTEPMRRFNNLQNIVSKVSKDLDTAYKKLDQINSSPSKKTNNEMVSQEEIKKIDELTKKIATLEKIKSNLSGQSKQQFSHVEEVKKYNTTINQIAELRSKLDELKKGLSNKDIFKDDVQTMTELNRMYRELTLSSSALVQQQKQLLEIMEKQKNLGYKPFQMAESADSIKQKRVMEQTQKQSSSLNVQEDYSNKSREYAQKAFKVKDSDSKEYEKLMTQSRKYEEYARQARTEEIRQLNEINNVKIKSEQLSSKLSEQQKINIQNSKKEIEELAKLLKVNTSTVRNSLLAGKERDLYRLSQARIKENDRSGAYASNAEMYQESASVNKIFKSLVNNPAMKLKVEMDSSTIQRQLKEAQKFEYTQNVNASRAQTARVMSTQAVIYGGSGNLEGLEKLRRNAEKNKQVFTNKGDTNIAREYDQLLERINNNINKINESRERGLSLTNRQLDYDRSIGRELERTRNSNPMSSRDIRNNRNQQREIQEYMNSQSSLTTPLRDTNPTQYMRQTNTTSAQKMFYEMSTLHYGLMGASRILNPSALMNYERQITGLGVASQLGTPLRVNAMSSQILGDLAGTPVDPSTYVGTLQEVIKTGRSYSEAINIVANANRLAGASFDNLATATNVLNKQMMALDLDPTADRTRKLANQMHNALINTSLDISSLDNATKQSGTVFSALAQMAELKGVDNLDQYKEDLYAYNLALTGSLVQKGKTGGQAGTTVRNMLTKLTQLDNTGVKRLNSDLQRATTDQLSVAGFGSAKELQELIQVDFEKAINGVSKLVNEGVISFSTIQKMFTERHSSSALSVFADVNSDLDSFQKKMLEGKSIIEDQKFAWANWASQVDAVRNNITILKQNLVGSLGSAPLLFGASGLNMGMTALNKGIAGGNPLALLLQGTMQSAGYMQLFKTGSNFLRDRLYNQAEMRNTRQMFRFDNVGQNLIYNSLVSNKGLSDREAQEQIKNIRTKISQAQVRRLRDIDNMGGFDVVGKTTGVDKFVNKVDKGWKNTQSTGSLNKLFNVDEASKYYKTLNDIERTGIGITKVFKSSTNILSSFFGSPLGLMAIATTIANIAIKIYQSWDSAQKMMADSAVKMKNSLDEIYITNKRIEDELNKSYEPNGNSFLNVFSKELQTVIDQSKELTAIFDNFKAITKDPITSVAENLKKIRDERNEQTKKDIEDANLFNSTRTTFKQDGLGSVYKSFQDNRVNSARDSERLKNSPVRSELEKIEFDVRDRSSKVSRNVIGFYTSYGRGLDNQDLNQKIDDTTLKHLVATAEIQDEYEKVYNMFKDRTEFKDITNKDEKRQAIFSRYAYSTGLNNEGFYQQYLPLAKAYNIELDKTLSLDENIMKLRRELTETLKTQESLTQDQALKKADDLITGQMSRSKSGATLAGERDYILNLIEEETKAYEQFNSQIAKLRAYSDDIIENSNAFLANQSMAISKLTGSVFVPNVSEQFFASSQFEEARKTLGDLSKYENIMRNSIMSNPTELLRNPESTLKYSAQIQGSLTNEIGLELIKKQLQDKLAQDVLDKKLKDTEKKSIENTIRGYEEAISFEQKKRVAIEEEYRLSIFNIKKREELLQAEMRNNEATANYLNSARSAFGFKSGDLENAFNAYRNNLQYMNEVGYNSFNDQVKVFNQYFADRLKQFGIGDPTKVTVSQVNALGTQLESARLSGATSIGGVSLDDLQKSHATLTSIVNERLELNNREIEIMQQRRNIEIELVKIDLERNKLASVYIDSTSVQSQKFALDSSKALQDISGLSKSNESELLVRNFMAFRDYSLERTKDQTEQIKLGIRQAIANTTRTINAIKMLENSDKQNSRLLINTLKNNMSLLTPKVDTVSRTVDSGDKQEISKLTDIDNNIINLNQNIIQAISQSMTNAITDFGSGVTDISGNTALEAILNGVSKNETGIADYKAVKSVGQIVPDTAKNGKTSYSYGAFGINDLFGSMKDFLSYKDYGTKFGLNGLAISSDAFKAQWKKMAEMNTKAFAEAQADFILNKSNPASARKHMKEGLDPKFANSMGIYGILVDAYVQEGAGGRTAKNVRSGKYKNIKDYDALVRAMYNDSNKTYQNRQNVRYFEIPKAVANVEASKIANQTNKTVMDGILSPLNTWANNINNTMNQAKPQQVQKTLVGDNIPKTSQTNVPKMTSGKNIANLVNSAVANKTPYVWGGMDIKTGVDCSGWTFNITGDPQGRKTASEQIRTNMQAGGGKVTDINKIANGMLVGIDNGRTKDEVANGDRWEGIDHIAYVYLDSNGQEMVTESTRSGGGVRTQTKADFIKRYGNKKILATKAVLSQNLGVSGNYYGGSSEYNGYTFQEPEPQFRLGDDDYLTEQFKRLKVYDLTKDLTTNQNTLAVITSLQEQVFAKTLQGMNVYQAQMEVWGTFIDENKGQTNNLGIDFDVIRNINDTITQSLQSIYQEFYQTLQALSNKYLETMRGINFGNIMTQRDREKYDTNIRNLRNPFMTDYQREVNNYIEATKDRDAILRNSEVQRGFQVSKDYELRNTLISAYGIDSSLSRDEVDSKLMDLYVKQPKSIEELRKQEDELKQSIDDLAKEMNLTNDQLKFIENSDASMSPEEFKNAFFDAFDKQDPLKSIFNNLSSTETRGLIPVSLDVNTEGMLPINFNNQKPLFSSGDQAFIKYGQNLDTLNNKIKTYSLTQARNNEIYEQNTKLEEARANVVKLYTQVYTNSLKEVSSALGSVLFESDNFRKYSGQSALDHLLNESNIGKFLLPRALRNPNTGEIQKDADGNPIMMNRPTLTGLDFFSAGVDLVAIFDEMSKTSLKNSKQELDAQQKMLEMQMQMAETTKERRDLEDQMLEIKKQQINAQYQEQTSFMGIASGTSGGALQGLTGGLSQGLNIIGALGASNPIGWGLTAGLGVFGAIGGAKSSLNAYASAQQEKANLEAQQKLTRVMEDQTKYLQTISEATQETAKWITKIGVVDATNRVIYSTIGIDPSSFGGTASETYTVGKKKKKWGGLVSKSWSENRVETASINLADTMFGGREFEDIGDIEWALATLQNNLLNNSLLQGFNISGVGGSSSGFNPFKVGTKEWLERNIQIQGSAGSSGIVSTPIVDPTLMANAQNYLAYAQVQSGIELNADQFKSMVLGGQTLDSLGIRNDISGQGYVDQVISVLESRLDTASRTDRVNIKAQLDLMTQLKAVLDKEGLTTKRQFGQYYGFETEEIKDENGNITEYRRINESVWSDYYTQIAQNVYEGTKNFDTAQTVIQGTLNAYIQNVSSQRSPIKQITEELNTLSDELYEMIRRTGNLSNLDATFQSLIHNTKLLTEQQKETDRLYVDLSKSWVKNGGLITDVVSGMNNGLNLALNSIKEGLTGASLEDNLTKLGQNLYESLSDSISDSLINSKYADTIFNIEEKLAQAKNSGSISDAVALANAYKSASVKIENDRDRANALSQLFTANRDIDYRDENLQYETGTTQSVTYNTTLNQPITIGGSVLGDGVSMQQFVDYVTPMVVKTAKELGII